MELWCPPVPNVGGLSGRSLGVFNPGVEAVAVELLAARFLTALRRARAERSTTDNALGGCCNKVQK